MKSSKLVATLQLINVARLSEEEFGHLIDWFSRELTELAKHHAEYPPTYTAKKWRNTTMKEKAPHAAQ